MKKLSIIFSLFFLFGIAVNAQNNETQPVDATVQAKKKARDRLIFSISFDNVFHKETNGFKSFWYGSGFGMHYMHDFPIKNSQFSVAPGLGFQYANYYHNSTISEDSLGTHFNPIENFRDNDDFKRHKLGVTYLEIPLELRFFSKPNPKNGMLFKAALGFKAGLRVAAHEKEKRKGDNEYFKKVKTKGYRDLNIIRAGPTLRIGYGAFNIFGFYSVTNLFKNDLGPEMTPFNIGISITTL